MKSILTEKLKNLVQEKRSSGTPDAAVINAIKEALQYPVLDFVYNNREYSNLVMYGGTLLRIGYDLPRMSEDLDFQTDNEFHFTQFAVDLTAYFQTTYNIKVEISEAKKEKLNKATTSVYIKFPTILGESGLTGHGLYTVLKIRLDVNYLSRVSNFAHELIPIVRDTYAFSIKTFPLSTLMASKIAAVLLRRERGIGNEMCDCKPRDIYDLMWYMGQKIIPNLKYLEAIHTRVGEKMEAKNILDLFDKLMLRVGNLDDKLFAKDLGSLFYNPEEYDDWHRNWRERFRILRNSYEIYRIKSKNGKPNLSEIHVREEFSSENRYFHFYFSTEEPENKSVKFTCILSDYWANYQVIPTDQRIPEIEKFIQNKEELSEFYYQYIGLFYAKIEDYLQRNDFVVLQRTISTKIIRLTGVNLNVKTQILLDLRLLRKENFEDLI